jgi:hypothetical protein
MVANTFLGGCMLASPALNNLFEPLEINHAVKGIFTFMGSKLL